MEAVEDVALLEELALGRVDVLALERVVVAEAPRLEPDHPAARIREREHQPEREEVVAALVGEAGCTDLLQRESALASLRDEACAAREPEAELTSDLVSQPAACEVLAYGRARLRLPQYALEVRGRLFEQRAEPLPPAADGIGLRRGFLVLEGHAEPVGEPLDRAGEVEVLGFLDEADDVAALAAAEAVVQLVDGVDGEARSPFLVEGAPAREACARGAPEGGPERHDLDDVRGCLHLGDARVLDPRHRATLDD